MLEYKIITDKDSTFSGKFDYEDLVAAMNSHAEDGWRVVEVLNALSLKKFGAEIAVVFERERPQS